MIDLAYVQEQIEMNKRKELLKKHPYKIWEGKDGKWYSYFPDEENGRIMRKRKYKNDIEDLICEYWREKAENPKIVEIFNEWIYIKLEYKEIQKGSKLETTTIAFVWIR